MRTHLNSKTRDLHSKIVSLIVERGECHGKKHGNWFILRLTPNLWFELDSWNKQVTLRHGTPGEDKERIYWCGCDGQTICYVGIDFGGYESKLNEKQYQELIELIEKNT